MLIQKSKVCKVASVGFLSLALASSVAVGNTHAEGASSYFDWNAQQCIIAAVNSDDDIASIAEAPKPVSDINSAMKYADKLTKIECPDKKITNFRGVVNLTNLVELDLADNNISSIDFSLNNSLKKLDVSNNKLTSVTLPREGVLEDLDVSHNELAVLDVSNNDSLLSLRAFSNKLTFINVARNSRLENLLVDNILVYAGIVPPTETKDGYVFNLSSLKYMKDGTEHENGEGVFKTMTFSIKDTDYYTYDKDNMTLTVKDKKKTGEFVQVVGLSKEGDEEKEEKYFSYKLKLFDAEEEEDDMKVPNTGGNTNGSEFITAILVGLPVMGAIILGTLLTKGYQRASRKVDFK
ncbi:leucine-rich repeat domain-containing protein [Candidatus Saccharibacteria bacterium]|nr:leucine-rich repeat domain-containing protein [Candidatus Saccharibacteria bacterium]